MNSVFSVFAPVFEMDLRKYSNYLSELSRNDLSWELMVVSHMNARARNRSARELSGMLMDSVIREISRRSLLRTVFFNPKPEWVSVSNPGPEPEG